MIVLRSILFNVLFYLNLTLFLLLGSWFLLMPRKTAMRALQLWARTSVWLMWVCCGTGIEVRGREHIPTGPCLVAGKHQSFWETFALLTLFDDPAIVLKRELTYIPLFGWFAVKFRMIPVERSSGSSALRNMVSRAKREIAEGRQIIIMPEGTRRAPDAPPHYKPGAAALYGALKVPCVPFGLNAGLFWPRRKFLRLPGTIVVEFLPVIEAGLQRHAFQQRLEDAIETCTTKLVSEGRAKQK
jgi:1-acyl-sn-glycerol-3-phosphate acyltransferase